jgi:hypothetical protein
VGYLLSRVSAGQASGNRSVHDIVNLTGAETKKDRRLALNLGGLKHEYGHMLEKARETGVRFAPGNPHRPNAMLLAGNTGQGCGDECFQLATVQMTPCASFPSVISLAGCATFGTRPLSDEVVVCEMYENLLLLHLHFDVGNKPGGVYSQYLTVKFGVFHNA